MLYWGVVLLSVALLAAPVGFAGAAGMSMSTAWVLFIIGLIFATGFLLMERRHGK